MGTWGRVGFQDLSGKNWIEKNWICKNAGYDTLGFDLVRFLPKLRSRSRIHNKTPLSYFRESILFVPDAPIGNANNLFSDRDSRLFNNETVFLTENSSSNRCEYAYSFFGTEQDVHIEVHRRIYSDEHPDGKLIHVFNIDEGKYFSIIQTLFLENQLIEAEALDRGIEMYERWYLNMTHSQREELNNKLCII